MKRKLASVRVVEEILPIVGADAIEAVRLGGWACVVRKGAFQTGDQGVYFEIDAVLPDSEAFRFLWTPKGEVQRAGLRPASFRLRTKKLRGCLSQGLFMRFDELGLSGAYENGQDLTEQLGVEKWDPPLPTGAGDTRGAFPAAVPKTDEMRVQSVPAVLEELRGHAYVATQKCDGTSATFLIDPFDGTFHACSRNWSLKEGENLTSRWPVSLAWRRSCASSVVATLFRVRFVAPASRRTPWGWLRRRCSSSAFLT